jgi:hypothetical protein
VNLDKLLAGMQDSLSDLAPELVPIHERLVSLRRQLVRLGAQEQPSKSGLRGLVEELREIDSYALNIPYQHNTNKLTKADELMESSYLNLDFMYHPLKRYALPYWKVAST